MRRQLTAWQAPPPQLWPYGQPPPQHLPHPAPPFPHLPSVVASLASFYPTVAYPPSMASQIPVQISPQSAPCPRKSSPISMRLDDAEVLDAFFRWKARTAKSTEQREKWARAGDIVRGQDWSIPDLKSMESGAGAMYTRAIAVGISDGFARRFASELRVYKDIHRKVELEAELLQGGEFI